MALPLCTLARASSLIPHFPTADNAVLSDCISASTEIITRYCNRNFVLTTRDDLYDGTGDFNLLLYDYPVTKVLRVSFNEVSVVQFRMSDLGCSRASWRMDTTTTDQPPRPGYLYLVSMKNGNETDVTIGPLTSASPTVVINGVTSSIAQMKTLQDLADRVNTYAGSFGWVSTAIGPYSSWAIADIRPINAAFESRWFGVSYLTLHVQNQPTYNLNPDIGELVSPFFFSRGYRNYRVIYQCGYPSVPEAIQQATAALAVSVYQARNLNTNVVSESLGGYSYTNIAEKSFHSLDLITKYGLDLYKNWRVAKYKLV